VIEKQGIWLDTSAERVRNLVEAYGSLAESILDSPALWATGALEAAHRGLHEVATLLGGEAPCSPEEEGYITERTIALQRLLFASQRRLADELPTHSGPTAELRTAERQSRAAMVTAMEEIEQSTGTGSVKEMESVTRWILSEEGSDVDAERPETRTGGPRGNRPSG
jgi:hypothetical protein